MQVNRKANSVISYRENALALILREAAAFFVVSIIGKGMLLGVGQEFIDDEFTRVRSIGVEKHLVDARNYIDHA